MPSHTADNPFGARARLDTSAGAVSVYRLQALADRASTDLTRLPFTVKVLLENVLRHCDGIQVTEDDVLALARWTPEQAGSRVLS
ncbi:MAG: hypothetical protein KGJ86_05960, partial [Chloroflexota bacterium]|nr:hypothetical protein [Chloroflexota bacterium]